ncbi:uncharacterized protein [Epargyreus clarus]|uniref:uncharacterized protein n=1 Tax=Epargyreus clarus TaxID=520877 RepID=UPI003C2E096D
MFLTKGVFLTFLYLSLCEGFAVENLPKCTLKDSECQRSLYETIVAKIGKHGMPELGIPSLDPMILKDVSVSVLNTVNLTMVDGVAKGIKKCMFERFEIDIEKERGSQAITCDLVIKGHYWLSANSPLVKDLLGDGGISGDGNGKVKMEKLYMTFDFPFYPVKKDDGEIYMKCVYEDIIYKYELKGKASFAADSIYLGKENVMDTLNKCSIKDNDCQVKMISSTLSAIQKTGIPELGIPPIDPMVVKDITVPILDLMELHVVEGTAKGAKDCVVEKYITEIEKGHSEMTLLCNAFTIKAKYKLSGSSPLLKNLFGGESLSGEGNGKVKMEKLRLKLDYYYDMKRNKDGDVYFHWKFNKTIYTYELLGKISFAADKVFLGKTDATQVVVGFLNENSKFIMNTFGKTFMDIAMELVYTYTHTFFNMVPAKYFILEDLSEYVKS